MAKNIKWTKEIDQEIINLHINKFWSITDISNKFNISTHAISRRIKKLGYSVINYQNLVEYSIEDIKEFIDQGYTLSNIADIYNVSCAAISRFIKINNIILKKSKFDEHIFDVINTEEKAYWLGFIFADGNISSYTPDKKRAYKFELSLALKDKNHLCKFNSFMNYNGNNIRCDSFRCRWLVGSKHLWKTLNSYGCTPNKSLTLNFPNESIFVSKDLIRHFIRGYFDGDGCIICTDKTKSVNLLGTPNFLTNCQKYFNVYNILHKNHNSNLTMRFDAFGKTAYRIAEFLYKDSTIYLDRKYTKYLKLSAAVHKGDFMNYNRVKTVKAEMLIPC